MAAQFLWLNEIVESVFGRRESREFKKNFDDIAILATIATYMRRDLHQNQGFYENILPR